MDAQLKAKWVEALRSGEYKQGRGSLLEDGNYCCLGVLCEIVGLPIREDGLGIVGYGLGDSSFTSYQPIFELVGGYQKSHQCSMRNDGNEDEEIYQHSFPEIADYIDEHL